MVNNLCQLYLIPYENDKIVHVEHYINYSHSMSVAGCNGSGSQKNANSVDNQYQFSLLPLMKSHSILQGE